MKPFGIVLVALLMLGLGYQVAYPKMFDEGFFPRPHGESERVTSVLPATPKTNALPQSLPASPIAPAVPALKNPSAEPPSAVPSTPATPASTSMPALPTDDPSAFHPPVFPPIEQVVKNWAAVPPKVFPRPVKVGHEVAFTMAAGRAVVPAGGMVIALDQSGLMLDVAPSPNSPARGRIALDDTDLKESLTKTYEEWKTATIEFRHRQFVDQRDHPTKPTQPSPAPLLANDKPTRNGDGSYPVLLDSMKRGQVSEITPSNVTGWSEPASETVDGKAYWIVKVKFTVITLIGPIETEADARIFRGRVEKWIYTKSREVVP